MLLPLETMGTLNGFDLFTKYGVYVGLFHRHIDFDRGDRRREDGTYEKIGIGKCAWYFGNFPNTQTGTTMIQTFYIDT